jgi:hypothetical protein
VASSEKITDADDLKAATSQKAAMDKASTSLLATVQWRIFRPAGIGWGKGTSDPT